MTSRAVVLLYAGMSAAAVIWMGLRGQFDPLILPKHDAHHWALASFAGAGAGFAMVAISMAVERLPCSGDMVAWFVRVLGPVGARRALIWAGASSVGEELFFRGAMLPAAGFTVTTLAFGLLHFAPARGMWLWTVMACAFGAILGGLALWTGGIWAPVVAHFTVNYLNLRRLDRFQIRPI